MRHGNGDFHPGRRARKMPPDPGVRTSMKPGQPFNPIPFDAAARKSVAPVVCHPVDGLPAPDLAARRAARDGWALLSETLVPPRPAKRAASTCRRATSSASSRSMARRCAT